MQKNKTTNGFKDALNLDYSPLLTPNTVMTNALNATLLTMNGNELTLQNDMGNGRVETAYLPEGYIPLGTAELGGIIYIVSYNPLTNKSLIGSFPSPERNITSKESSGVTVPLEEKDFYSDTTKYIISTPYKRLDITEDELNPGDKYLIYCSNFNDSVISKEEESSIDDEGDNYISAYGEVESFDPRLLPRYVRFSIVSIASNGQVVDMTDSCVWLPLLGHTGYYFMCDLNPTTIDGNTDLDDYRSLVTSNYNVFGCKSSGKLGILAQLECISSFEITWDAIKENNTWKFYFFTNWTYENDVEPDKINLYGLYVESKIDDESTEEDIVISQYPYSVESNSIELTNTDIMEHQQIIEGTDEYNFQFHNPKYIDSLSYIYDKYIEETIDNEESEEDPFAKYVGEYYEFSEKLLRKNDGSDNQFLISTPITTDQTEGILTLEISPTMPYGKLYWLKQTFNIDLSKLGTGEIDLVEYRYYILNNSIILSWGLDAYPERNKKINSVDFNFYEINDKIMDWIYDNQKYIDDYKVINGEWTDGTKCTEFPDVDTDYPFTVTGKSSYSGHFEESLNIYEEGEQDNVLIQNKVYLLLIDIDYSDKHIYYYRIFYTEPIFNDCYYKDDYIDYANIDLDDILNLSFNINNISIDPSLDYTYTTLLGSDEEIDIPSFLTEEEHTQNPNPIDYTVHNDYVADVSFEVQGTVGYSSFVVDATFSDSQSDHPSIVTYDSHNNLNELTPTSYYRSGSSLRTTPTLSIETTIDTSKFPTSTPSGGNIISLRDFNVHTEAQLKVTYDYYTAANIEYLLSSIKCTSYFINGQGSAKSMGISITKSVMRDYTYHDDYSFSNNNDGHREIDFDQTENIYSTIDAALKDNDLVCIGGCLHSTNKNEPYGIVWGYGNWTKTGGTDSGKIYNNHMRWLSDTSDEKGNFSKACAILFYAIRRDGDVLLISYNFKLGDAWISGVYSLNPEKTLNWRTNNIYAPAFLVSAITSNDEITEDVMMKPFTNLYKPISYGGTYYIWEWSVIDYFSTFEETYELDITVTNVNVNLTINSDVKYDNGDIKVKNLHYSSPRTCEILYVESKRINIDSVVNKITTSDVGFVAYDVNTDERKLIQMDISPTRLYIRNNDNFTPTNYLPNLSGNDSKLKIKCTNEMIAVDNNAVSTAFNAAWMYDDMGIAVKNIYIIE